MRVRHTFEPVWDPECHVLILGSFPSVKSREQGFYYGHPRNRFWQVIAGLTGETVPETIPEKKQLLLKWHIAVWDVIESCEISGSSDSSIREARVNDLQSLVKGSNIRRVFANGGKAFELYEKYGKQQTGLTCVKLPSTSPANAAFSLERLLREWACVLEEI